MSLISFTAIQDGVTGVNAAATNTPLSTIFNDYNGNISNANIASNAAIAGSKISYASTANPYKFWAYQSSGQSIGSTGSDIKINLQSTVFDTSSNFNTTTSLFTAPVTGFYFFSWAVTFPLQNNSVVNTVLYVNATVTNGITGTTGANSTGGTQTKSFVGSGLLQLSANDTVELRINAGNTGTLNAFRSQTFLQGFLISAT